MAQEAFLAGNYFLTWCSWCAASLVGIAVGNLVPGHWGLGFAGVLCLVGIVLLAGQHAHADGGGASSPARRRWPAYALPLKLNVVVAIAVAVLAAFWLETRGSSHPRERTV